jgi:hypothetical protein
MSYNRFKCNYLGTTEMNDIYMHEEKEKAKAGQNVFSKIIL